MRNVGLAAALVQHVGDHAGRGGLAVRAGHGDAAPHGHDAGEHLRPLQHRQAAAARLGELHVALRHGRRDDDQRGLAEIGLVVADADRDAGRLDEPCVAADLEVGAGDAHAEAGQHQRDARSCRRRRCR